VTKNFEYRGDLTQTALPEMLFAIHRFQVPGVIEARRDGIVKRIYVKHGQVLHATSTDIGDSLGSYLRRTGRLTAEHYEATMAARRDSEKRYGALLVERGLLQPCEVYEGIRDQIEAIVWSLFYWQEGEVSFQIGEFQETGGVRILLPMRQVILAGIKRAPNAKTLVGRLGRKETVFAPAFHTEDLIETALNEEEHAVLSKVDGRRTLYEVCVQGPPPPPEAAKLMYAFFVLQLIRRVGEAAESGVSRETDSGQIRIRLKTEWDRKS
jgi:Domain of unknown function (DUF4388)